MFRFKTTLNFVIVLTALLGLVIGCGNSAEKQTLMDFLVTYDNAVKEYSAADESKRAEMKEKLDSFKTKWVNIEMEMGSELTPQELNKLDNEYQKITKKYISLTHKS
ncbi:MAG: hypothetical protein JRF60_04755 [Deltaproteobacteria bacterium]|nr:hypothetical protein [Deltaproteobacteria bacterium]